MLPRSLIPLLLFLLFHAPSKKFVRLRSVSSGTAKSGPFCHRLDIEHER